MNKFLDFFRISTKNLLKRRLRSWLTMVGIFIGIAAVVALISLGEGLQASIDAEFKELGTDKIIISPAGSIFGAGGVNALSEDDIDLLQGVRGVESAAGYLFTTAQIEVGDEIFYYIVAGFPTDPEQLELMLDFYDLAEGRMLRKGENKKAVIGHDYAFSPAFEKNVDVGDKITIKDETFDIVGRFERIGNAADDRTVVIPMDTARDLLGIDERIDSIFVKAKAGSQPAEVAQRIEREMRRDRDQKEGEEDFSVQTFDEFLESFLSIINIVTTFLAFIAAISLLVGGIGIMNTMYTAVIERTKEIGIMKAIGAKNSDVLTLFLIESGMLGMAGGLIGVIIGAVFSTVAATIATAAGGFTLKASFPLWLVGGAFLFSFLVGCLAGFVPAYQASRKHPVDALRYG